MQRACRQKLETYWAPRDNGCVSFKFKVQSKFILDIEDASNRLTPSQARFSRLLVCVDYGVS